MVKKIALSLILSISIFTGCAPVYKIPTYKIPKKSTKTLPTPSRSEATWNRSGGEYQQLE